MAELKLVTVKYTIDFKQRGQAFLQAAFSETGDPNDRDWIIRQINQHVTEILRLPLDWNITSGCYWSTDQPGIGRGIAKPLEMQNLQASPGPA